MGGENTPIINVVEEVASKEGLVENLRAMHPHLSYGLRTLTPQLRSPIPSSVRLSLVYENGNLPFPHITVILLNKPHCFSVPKLPVGFRVPGLTLFQ